MPKKTKTGELEIRAHPRHPLHPRSIPSNPLRALRLVY